MILPKKSLDNILACAAAASASANSESITTSKSPWQNVFPYRAELFWPVRVGANDLDA